MSNLSDLRAWHCRGNNGRCNSCDRKWPCDTIKALDYADALTRRLEEAEHWRQVELERANELLQERDRALADGAVLRRAIKEEALDKIYDLEGETYRDGRRKLEALLAQPHPGSALLHELERVRGERDAFKKLANLVGETAISEHEGKVGLKAHWECCQHFAALQPLLDAVKLLPKVHDGGIHDNANIYEVKRVLKAYCGWTQDEADALAVELRWREEQP